MNIVISDPKSKKAYAMKADNAALFMGKRIGEEVELGLLGLEGYKALITGGSDKQGFPMKNDMRGTMRRNVVLTVDAKKGTKMKVTRRGNTVSDEAAQINLKVTKEGAKPLSEIIAPSEKKEEGSVKEQMVKESLENVGKISAEEAKNIKKAK